MNRSFPVRPVATAVLSCAALLLLGGFNSAEISPDLPEWSKIPEYVEGEVLVDFGTLSREAIRSAKRVLSLRTLEVLPQLHVERLKIESGMPVGEVARALLDRGVAFAEPNYLLRPALLPNDPDLDRLYGLERIRMEEAWDISTGGEIVVAVIDTGQDYTHPDLEGNNWINTLEDLNGNGRFDEEDLNGIDDDGNGYIDDVIGYNFVEDSPFLYTNADKDAHGTHVSGTIGAVGNNGIGISGVLWQVRIMRLKFIDRLGNVFDAAQAIVYAVDNGARISNNSWGGANTSETLVNAVKYAYEHGMIFVAAAGNYHRNNDRTPYYPAAYPYSNVIAVAATNENDRLASFSNYGSRSVDVAAPGAGIYSTLPDATYGELDGTSMATPHVAGVAALLLLIDPELSAKEVRDILVNTSRPVVTLEATVAAGGRIDAARALECASTGENCERWAPRPEPGGCGIVVETIRPGSLLPLVTLAILLLLRWRTRTFLLRALSISPRSSKRP